MQAKFCPQLYLYHSTEVSEVTRTQMRAVWPVQWVFWTQRLFWTDWGKNKTKLLSRSSKLTDKSDWIFISVKRTWNARQQKFLVVDVKYNVCFSCTISTANRALRIYCKHWTVNYVKDPAVAKGFWQSDSTAGVVLWSEYKQSREKKKSQFKSSFFIKIQKQMIKRPFNLLEKWLKPQISKAYTPLLNYSHVYSSNETKVTGHVLKAKPVLRCFSEMGS